MQGTLRTIHADTRADTILNLDRPVTLDELQQAVGGGFIELVPAFNSYLGRPCAVFCDEEGKIKGLPYNKEASIAWCQNCSGHHLCGDVVIVTGDRAFMNAL